VTKAIFEKLKKAYPICQQVLTPKATLQKLH